MPRADETPDSFRFFHDATTGWRITFNRGAYDALMTKIRGRAVYHVKLHAWDNMHTAEYGRDKEDREFITLYLPNLTSSWLGPVSARSCQRRLVYALAHESGHACQTTEKRRWYDTIVGLTPSALLTAATLWGLGYLAKVLWSMTPSFGAAITNLILFLLAGGVALLLIGGYMLLGVHLGYKWSWTERDADAFATRAMRNSEWQSLFTVEPLPVTEIRAAYAQPPTVYEATQS